MRKIEKEVIGAFIKGDTKAVGNTQSVFNHVTRNLDLLLHGNRIATMSNRDGVKKLWVSCGGYEKEVNGRKVLAPSRTAQSRLNALFRLLDMPEHVYIKGGVQYIDSRLHGTVNLMALRKSALLVWEFTVLFPLQVGEMGLGKSALSNSSAPKYFDCTVH